MFANKQTVSYQRRRRRILKRKRLESDLSTTSALSQLSTSSQTSNVTSSSHLSSETSVDRESYSSTPQSKCVATNQEHIHECLSEIDIVDAADKAEDDKEYLRPVISRTKFYLDDEDIRNKFAESADFDTLPQRTVLPEVPCNVSTNRHLPPTTSNNDTLMTNHQVYSSLSCQNNYISPTWEHVHRNDGLQYLNFEEERELDSVANDLHINFNESESEYEYVYPSRKGVHKPKSLVIDKLCTCKNCDLCCHRMICVTLSSISVAIIMLNVVALPFIYVSTRLNQNRGVECYKCAENQQGLTMNNIRCCRNSKIEFTSILELVSDDLRNSSSELSNSEQNSGNYHDILGRYMGSAYIKLEVDEQCNISQSPRKKSICWKKRPTYCENIAPPQSQTSILIQKLGYYFVYCRMYLLFSLSDVKGTNCSVRIMTRNNNIMSDDISETFVVENSKTEDLIVLESVQRLQSNDKMDLFMDIHQCNGASVLISPKSFLILFLIST